MSRSLKVAPKYIERVKLARKRCGFPSVKAFATEMGIAYATASNFLNGHPVDYLNFVEFSEKLGLDWQSIVYIEPDLPPLPTDNPSVTSATKSVANTPPENVSHQGIDPSRFIGRERELAELHELLQQNGQVAITAVAGMAGVGKTELAIQYARQHLADYPGGACRLAGQEPQMGVELIRFFEDGFNLIAPDDRDLPSRVQFCWKRWQRDGEVLVLLDDVKRYSEIEDYLPPRNSRFKVLMTTQLDFSLNSSVQQLSVKVPELKAAIEILQSFIGKSRISQESEIAAELCQWLGCLPLALTLVGSYLQEFPKLSLQTMLARLKNQKLQHASFDPQHNPTLDKKSSRALAAAFELSWERLGEMDENAQTIGCRLSLYALAPIPLSFEADEEDLSPNLSPARREALNFHVPPSLAGKGVRGLGQNEVEVWETAIKNLRKLHLLDEKGAESYQLHSLIREFFQDKLAQLKKAEDLKRDFVAKMAAVAKQLPYQANRDLIVAFNPNIPHLIEVAKHHIAYLSNDDLPSPFTALARFYRDQGFYDLAAPWLEERLAVTKVRFGSEHHLVASYLNNLAMLYENQGRYSEAEPLFLQALELNKHLLGDEHEEVATCLRNLANLYDSQGLYKKAEPLILQALKLNKRLLGDEHSHVAGCLNNLAMLYQSQARYREAEPLLVEALEMWKRLLGEEHRNVAICLNNLALVYEDTERYEEAESLYLEALELFKRLLGEEHPDVAKSLYNLAMFYQSQGRHSEAQQLYVQALTIREQRLGSGHPLTVKVRENFTNFLRQVIREGAADLEMLEDNPLVREILEEVSAEIEQSQDTTNE
ncbi:tetratricopeptide repeat protein [Argonema galeatum]|uniref:tetratricopeptide repeat protein n=1 Tax=Argonema galeatum TaxID=2942762 RepID=UPI002012DB7E|nr:tetratricopeptide repeat protein [Argonema galeatum]MCL1463566.1 tetratricopeptide repeat protein [Argonema galeatum A003/A1]